MRVMYCVLFCELLLINTWGVCLVNSSFVFILNSSYKQVICCKVNMQSRSYWDYSNKSCTAHLQCRTCSCCSWVKIKDTAPVLLANIHVVYHTVGWILVNKKGCYTFFGNFISQANLQTSTTLHMNISVGLDNHPCFAAIIIYLMIHLSFNYTAEVKTMVKWYNYNYCVGTG